MIMIEVYGNITVVGMMTVTLSAEHRVVDGVTATKFLQGVKALLETPHNPLVH